MKKLIRRIIPQSVYSLYHFVLALLGALRYGFPSRRLVVIGITGTKGKTSTTELLNGILEAAGKRTAVLGTLRFKIGEKNERNLKKMTMPGRFFVQKFLSDAVAAGCTHAIIEMTSEGAKQYRQRFVDMDALIFTNLSPEHIESHGSFENYRDAKLSIARTLARSSKKHRYMVANADDDAGRLFLSVQGVEAVPFSIHDAEPVEATASDITLSWDGERVTSLLPGLFNTYNIIAAATCATKLGIAKEAILSGITNVKRIEGRAERIEGGQHFPVIVDYAHTPDSLEALYTTFKGYENVCILGNTGGGRDKWKRPVMGKIAEAYCTEIILTNEDPYDEDPREILEEIASGMTEKKPLIILDRREAIAKGIARAKVLNNPALLITGKGTDPYIMGPNGTKTPWDDRDVAREELLASNKHR
jgi:UDP-N-acetylmuramoyl-L-alanyl-D-glutamate--2,6-diaminopimelate ligase